MTKRRKRLVTALVVVGVLALAVVLGLYWLRGSALRQFTNGKLVAGDYWRDDPMILSGGTDSTTSSGFHGSTSRPFAKRTAPGTAAFGAGTATSRPTAR